MSYTVSHKLSCLPISLHCSILSFVLLFRSISDILQKPSLLVHRKSATMAATRAALMGALVAAVSLVLLQSSMGQEPMSAPASAPTLAPVPAPAPNCSTCLQNCNAHCQGIADSDYRKCEPILASVYAACFKGCSNGRCNGTYGVTSCEVSTCSASGCGCPCHVECCKACTIPAGQASYSCTSAAGRVMQFCMPDCTMRCTQCRTPANGSAPPPATS